MSAVDLAALADDVRAEHLVLNGLLVDLPDAAWDAATPAPRWSVRDQITHLAFFDNIARMAIAEPEDFVAFRDGLSSLPDYVDEVSEFGAGRSGQEMLQWWADERRGLIDAALHADPGCRVPWFGPSMSLASKLTARLMETWAHGQDIVDALGLSRPPSARLRHVARIGVLAFPNSFRVNGLSVPAVSVRVSLAGPDAGTRWHWGDLAAEDWVEGSAEDFCLVVTQRRHVDETGLKVRGDIAATWMRIAQAFAGPPGDGRKPGQFPRRDGK